MEAATVSSGKAFPAGIFRVRYLNFTSTLRPRAVQTLLNETLGGFIDFLYATSLSKSISGSIFSLPQTLFSPEI